MWTIVESDQRPEQGTRVRGHNGGSEIIEGLVCLWRVPASDGIDLDRDEDGREHQAFVTRDTWESWTDDPATPEAPAPEWSPVSFSEIVAGDYIRAPRTDDPGYITEGTVSSTRIDWEGVGRVVFQPGSTTQTRPGRVGTNDRDITVMDNRRSFSRRNPTAATTAAPDPWVLFSWDDHSPTVGDPIKFSGYSSDGTGADRDNSGEWGTLYGFTPADAVNVETNTGSLRRGLSKEHRLWYRYATDTPTEGVPPVTEPQWAPVRTRDLITGDLIRLSFNGIPTSFPPELTGTVVRFNVAEHRVDIRLTIGGDSWSPGDVRRSLSTHPTTRRMERAVVTPATPTTDAVAPTWVTLPTDFTESEARSLLPLQTHVRYNTDGISGRPPRDGWVTGYGTAGYDFTVTGTQGSRTEQYGVNFRWEPQTLSTPELSARIAEVVAARPAYTWSPVTSRETLVPGMVIRGRNIGGYRNAVGIVCRVYTETEAGATWGTMRTTNGRHVSFRSPDSDGIEADLSTAPVVWGSTDVGWAEADRRLITPGTKTRSMDDPYNDVGEFVSLNDQNGYAVIQRESGRGRAEAPPRAVLHVWNDGTPQARRQTRLSNKDHLTLAGLKAAVFEFAKSEGDMFGAGSNCSAGTNEFLQAIGLPRQTWAPLVDESAEIDAFLKTVQEYLSRDSIGISREKADEYLKMWGLPKAPRRRRVRIYATLDGETTDAQIIERLPRVIRDATGVEVYAA